jgi:hypothetical protein
MGSGLGCHCGWVVWEDQSVGDSDADRFRTNAEECLRLAEKAVRKADREAWAKLADDWIRLAHGAELHGSRPRLN